MSVSQKEMQAIIAGVIAAMQAPVAAAKPQRKAKVRSRKLAADHPVARIAAAKATKGRCYATEYDVAPGGMVPDTKIVCPNGAYAVLTISDTLYWMDRAERTPIAQWDASCDGHAEMVAAVRSKYPAVLKTAK